MSLAGAKRPIDEMEQERLIDAAIRVLMKSTALSPTYDRQIILGEAYELAGRREEAEAVYRTALASGQSAGHEAATLSLARLLERTGRAEEALAVLQKASASGLQAASVRYEIGRLQFGKADFPGAIDALSPVVGTLPAAQTAGRRGRAPMQMTRRKRTAIRQSIRARPACPTSLPAGRT
jgi:tetratricopeptide (TPR) repeat protein